MRLADIISGRELLRLNTGIDPELVQRGRLQNGSRLLVEHLELVAVEDDESIGTDRSRRIGGRERAAGARVGREVCCSRRGVKLVRLQTTRAGADRRAQSPVPR